MLRDAGSIAPAALLPITFQHVAGSLQTCGPVSAACRTEVSHDWVANYFGFG